nr:uncharacterized protein LOC131775018 [Pocillopora verrucosa]
MSFEELRCSTDFTSGIHEHLMSLSAVNIFLSIAAVLGNTLIFVALRRESSLHPPSKLLFHNLATTDLCVGLIAEPLNVASWMSLVYEDWDVCRFSASASFMLRRRQTEVHERVQQEHPKLTVPLDIVRYRKAVDSAMWVQLAMVLCYLPYLVVMALRSNITMSSSYFLAWAASVSLVYFNSSLNPFLYCWKIAEVRQVVKEIIRQALCCMCSFINVD